MYCVSGGTTEEEKEIGGCACGGESRSVGDGHSSRNCADLQYSKGSAALYTGEFESYCTSLCAILYIPLPTEQAKMHILTNSMIIV